MTPGRLSKAVDRAAEAGHDRFYNIGPSTSDLGLIFQPENEKQEWREVVMAILAVLAEEGVS